MAERRNEARWIEKRNRWQINVQKDGQRKTFTSSIEGTKGKIAAERKADKWLKQSTIDSNIRLETMWQRFLEHLKPDENGKSANGTGYSYYNDVKTQGKNHILPVLQTKKMRNITQADWQSCIDTAYKKGLSKATLKYIRSIISIFHSYTENNNITIKPLRKLKIPDDAPVKEKRILQPDDLHTLFTQSTITIRGKEVECFYIHAFRFFVLTGLRRGELCALTNSNIEDNILYVRQSINKHNIITKGKSENALRWFILPKLAQEELAKQRQLLIRNEIISPYVFPNEYGEMLPPSSLYDRWQRYREQHGISCTLHELRHTMISLNKNTVPPEMLKLVVGHSEDMDTFGIYGHEVEGEKETATRLIDKTLNQYIK